MATTRKHKKNLIVSYKNLTDDIKELFKEAYPEGYSNYLQRFVKPNGEVIHVVPFETDDTAYMVKFEVKIDTLGEDLEKALFEDDDIDTKEDEFAPLSEALEKEEENTSHNERHLRHGDFEDIIDEDKKKKLTLGINKEEFKEAFGEEEDADEMDSYERLDDDEPTDDDFEPTDEDLRGIEEEYLDAEIPPLDATIPDEEAVVIPKKKAKANTKNAEPKATATKAKPAAKNAATKAKPVAKTVTTKAKTVAKPVVAKAKPAAKPVATKPKPAAKPTATKAKAATTPAASKAKPVAKPKVAAKPAQKPVAAKPASKPATKAPAKPATKAPAKPASKTASTKKKK